MDTALASHSPAPAPPLPVAEELAPGLVLEPAGFRARRGARVIRLSALQMRLLTILAERPGHVFSRAELEALLWNGRPVSPAALRATMKRLRTVLNAPGEPELVRNVRASGYVLVPDAKHGA